MAKKKSHKRIVIIGAGPCGLAAAYRLHSLGYTNWVVYEKQGKPGGLAQTVKDQKGFLWDIGGHVMFSRNRRFNCIASRLMGDDFIMHERESWIRTRHRWVPYPFQNNIHRLPEPQFLECLKGLSIAQKETKKIGNFRDWIYQSFGKGIARLFMAPYNSKVWAVPLETMGYSWIMDRVSVIDLKRLKENVAKKKDDISWGPNNRFRFPLHGGTGGFFAKFEPFVNGHIRYDSPVTSIDIDAKTVIIDHAYRDRFDVVINTSPLDECVAALVSRKKALGNVRCAARQLVHNSIYVVGIGLKKRNDLTKCWVYFPDKDIPFYRITYFSHYSPYNVPGGDTDTYSSLLCEVAFSNHHPVAEKEVLASTVRGLVKAGIISQKDTRVIASRFLKKIGYAYPVPTLGRDAALDTIQTYLEHNSIFSRGRFGTWKYEIGNMDHAVMMGTEIIERLLKGKKENIWKAQ